MQEKNKSGKKTGWKVVFIISMIAIAAGLGFTAWYLYQGYLAEHAVKEVQEAVVEESVVSVVSEVEENDGAEGEEAELPGNIYTAVENPIDFAALQAINPDLYAWIQIKDTNISYPIAQKAGDDEFYLHHDMYGESRYAGCIYTEECNAKDFSDPVTVIYGHNMKNGSMFQNVVKFHDRAFFDQHPDVYIYTPDAVRRYQIFAAYTYDDRHLMKSFDFTDRAVYEQYLAEVQQGLDMSANLRADRTVTADDKIITLSTCVGSGESTQRYLVQAVLAEQNPTIGYEEMVLADSTAQ